MSDENNIDNKKNNGLDFQRGFKPESNKNIPFPASYPIETRIFFEENVFEEIQKHSSETTSVEVGGVLIGEARFDNLGNYLYICGSIRAENTKNTDVSVTFTSETWDYIHEIKDKNYPNHSIIGWYHTHPGFGIFLSDMDKFIQDSTFNMPYSVAMVVDPKSSKYGIFAWQDGEIKSLKQCYVGKETIPLTMGTVGGDETPLEGSEQTADKEQTVESSNNPVISRNKGNDYVFYKIAFFSILFFNIGFLLASFYHNFNIANRDSIIQENTVFQMKTTKQMIASSIVLRIDPILNYLNSLRISATDTNFKDFRNFLDYIFPLCSPEDQAFLKKKYPWLFQNN